MQPRTLPLDEPKAHGIPASGCLIFSVAILGLSYDQPILNVLIHCVKAP